MESIDFRPVCTGWSTDLRAITPGATFSITSVILALTGPLPSIGWPSALTTRPTSSGPTGTSRMRPVHLTVSPSEMCSYSPRITAPTESRSMFSARPKVCAPPGVGGNSSISPCITSDRPCTRTMPSVTETTVPWLRMSALTPRPSMRLLISSEISAGLSCMTLSFFQYWETPSQTASGGERSFHLFQAGLDRGVQHLVTDHGTDAADQRGIDLDPGRQLAAKALLQRGRNFLQRLRIDREGAVDHRIRRAADGVLQRPELHPSFRHRSQAIVVDQHAQEVLADVRQALRHEADDQIEHLGGSDLGVGGDLQQLRLAGNRRQLVKPGLRALQVGRAGLEQGLGIGTCNGRKFGHGVLRAPSSGVAAGLHARRH